MERENIYGANKDDGGVSERELAAMCLGSQVALLESWVSIRVDIYHVAQYIFYDMILRIGRGMRIITNHKFSNFKLMNWYFGKNSLCVTPPLFKVPRFLAFRTKPV